MEIETEAVQFPEKEYINGIFVAMRSLKTRYEVENRRKNQCNSMFSNSVCAEILDYYVYNRLYKTHTEQNPEEKLLTSPLQQTLPSEGVGIFGIQRTKNSPCCFYCTLYNHILGIARKIKIPAVRY